jgi:hypothetical protein
MSVIVNARITRAYVGFYGVDNQFLGLVVHCETGHGEGMMEGHYYPVHPRHSKHHREDTPLAEMIRGWLEASGAESVDDMVGKYVRLDLTEQWSATPNRVGHIVDEGFWFSTKEIMNRWGERMDAAKYAAEIASTVGEGGDHGE